MNGKGEDTGVPTVIFKPLLVADSWRKANVRPLFKNAGRNNPGNYKLASLMSVVGRLLGNISRNQINLHLERHRLIKILGEHQPG